MIPIPFLAYHCVCHILFPNRHFVSRTVVAAPQNSLSFSQCLPTATLVDDHQYASTVKTVLQN